MTYPETVRFLYELRLHGLKLGLENTRRLAALAGNPQDQLRFIHVSGTNGKGSTCAMIEGVYRAAGLRVGLFTSPHLVSFRERIQVDRHWMTREEVVRGVAELRPLLAEFPMEHLPTFFEVVTVLALRHFADKKCELVLWETGMGGRLDATNIVRPLASLITNVQFDHQKWLGSTLAEIAAEKAGIIKAGVPALTAAEDAGALAVIRRVAREERAPLTIVAASEEAWGIPESWRLPLVGAHQRRNAALSLATVRVLQDQLPVRIEAVQRGLESLQWSGRMQVVIRPNGGQWLLDGAHNLAGMEALLRTLATEYGGIRPTFVLGMLQDKDWEAMCGMAGAAGRRVVLVPIRSDRSAIPEAMAGACGVGSAAGEILTRGSLAEALALVEGERFVVVAGSLYLVGEAMELLNLVPEGSCSERQLNEWVPPKNL